MPEVHDIDTYSGTKLNRIGIEILKGETMDERPQIELATMDDQELLEYRDDLRKDLSFETDIARGWLPSRETTATEQEYWEMMAALRAELKRAEDEVTRRWEAMERTDSFLNNVR